jgi:hypothetical protein
MALRLKNSSGNYIALDAPSSIASDVTLTLPNTDGDSGQYLQTNGSGALSWQTVTDTNTNLTRMSAVELTSGTSVTFSSIPSDAKRITLAFADVSLNNSSDTIIWRIGDAGGIETTGYQNAFSRVYGGGSAGADADERTNGWWDMWYASGAIRSGHITFSEVDTNFWTCSYVIGTRQTDITYYTTVTGGGSKTLSDTLTSVWMGSSNTATFDNGKAAIFYEV